MRCRIVRWQLSASLDGGRLSSRSLRHLERCSSCARHRHRLEQLHDRLRRGAALAPVPVQTTPVRWRRPAAVAVAAAVAALVVTQWPDASDQAPPAGTAATSADADRSRDDTAAPTAHGPVTPPADRVGSLAAGVDELARDNPLERELEALATDGRRGLHKALAISGLKTE